MITGEGGWSQLGGPSFLLFDENNDGLADYSGKDPGANVNCLDCKTTPGGQSDANFGSIISGPVPGMPSFPAMPPELSGVTEQRPDGIQRQQLSLHHRFADARRSTGAGV